MDADGYQAFTTSQKEKGYRIEAPVNVSRCGPALTSTETKYRLKPNSFGQFNQQFRQLEAYEVPKCRVAAARLDHKKRQFLEVWLFANKSQERGTLRVRMRNREWLDGDRWCFSVAVLEKSGSPVFLLATRWGLNARSNRSTEFDVPGSFQSQAHAVQIMHKPCQKFDDKKIWKNAINAVSLICILGTSGTGAKVCKGSATAAKIMVDNS